MKKDIFAKRKINRRILRAFFNVVQAVSLAVFIVMGTVYLVGIGQYGFGQSSIKSEIKSRVNSMTKIAGRYAALMQNKEALKKMNYVNKLSEMSRLKKKYFSDKNSNFMFLYDGYVGSIKYNMTKEVMNGYCVDMSEQTNRYIINDYGDFKFKFDGKKLYNDAIKYTYELGVSGGEYIPKYKNTIINKLKNNKKEEIFKNGIYSYKDEISPSYINLQNPKFIEIDNLFYGGLIITNYYREQTDIILKNLIETSIDMNISIFYEKQDPYKTIKDLTYHIGNVGTELKGKNQNRQDIDIAAFTYNDAKYIRKEIQVNNEDLYFLYIYINVYSENKKELEFNLNKIEGIAQSKGMQTRRANFRQEELFLSCLPIMQNNEKIKNAARRNILTSGLLATYPFISSNIFDVNGIFIGKNIYNNSMVFIDRYNTNKYKNANMCIFGTSGAGKSFYTKLLILRYKLMGIKQYIIDPDREYHKLCNELNGTLIKIGPTSNTYINVLEIRKESIEDGENGYLATKIGKLIGFFNLIFGELNEEEKAIIEEKLIEAYKRKNITFNDNSLYKQDPEKIIGKIFKENKDMPILEDLYNIFLEDKKTKKYAIKLIPFIKGSMNFFNNYTNVELENDLIIADVYDLGEENLKYGMYLFIDIFFDKIKENREEKKAIYLDEIWRLIGVTSNKEVAGFIYKIFKTIRKYGGSSVAITQDISDIFSLENGTYGKSILNNSSIKTFFALEEDNIKVLENFTNLSEKEKIEIKSLKRGENLMFVGDEHILVKIECSELEKEIIEGENKNEKNYNSN